MIPAIQNQLSRYTDRLAELDFLLSRPDIMADMGQFMRLSREHTEVAAVAERWARYRQREADLVAAREMLRDADMAELAGEEIAAAEAEIEQLDAELQRMLLPKDPDDARNAFLEIRAGTGGDESALFAGDLARMYTRYAEGQGWRVEVMSESPAELGGYKEIVLRVAGDGAYGQLRFESGGHRVQRVPVTETQGRIHTSAATVAVLPAPENIEIEIRPEDIRIDTMRSSGAGGQHVNTTDSAVRIIHLPTNIMVTSSEKSQHVNREKAMEQLKIRLYEKQRAEADAERAETRASQIGSGDRSQKVRTYNYPENRVTDHRIGLTLYSLDRIISGDKLQDVIEALITEDQARKLAAMDAVA